ncbi:STAS domain-containing protein [Umezawaea sp. Da 62-37]|uniref:STAS domain-containing protein n=1 Tax=Umezawaea sp. Da 62-37 TaxID=3075927 RepID=UPI0028F7218B|nr:STAS domain-containing protein [Umezawaea sp. Da 62-37]WNV88920.1 STAS domain-containing protein [Umezawaea sp. Da 62-37]
MSEGSATPNTAVITTGFHRGVPVLHCSGEVDMIAAAELGEEFARLLATGPPAVVIDLGDVAFFGSSGVSALVDAQKGADRDGIPLAVVTRGRPVLRPLESTLVDSVLTLCATVDEALDATARPDTDR